MAMTYLSNLVNPQVMADMISATLPKKIKFSPIAKIDNTLEGRAGNTITVPKFAYIGDAVDVAEGVEMGTTVLTATTTTATVKKAGKAAELTDESVLSGYGDPLGQATMQLGMAIASKIDFDCYNALLDADLVYDPATPAAISYNAIVHANAKFGDESDASLAKVLFIHPDQEETLLLDSNFISNDKYNADVIMNGHIGKIAGAEVVKSKKVLKTQYELATSATSGAVEVVATSATTGQVNITSVVGVINTSTGKSVPVEVGQYLLENTGTVYYYNPIVIVDAQDANEDPRADGSNNIDPALTIYMKRNVQVESDRDILKKTTVVSADEHYVAVLSNPSKVVVAKLKVPS